MSTNATATIVAIPSTSLETGADQMSTTGVGDVVALPLLLAAGAAVVVGGTVILTAKGIAWCGEKLRENYEAAVNSWWQAQDASYRASLQNLQSQSDFVTYAVQKLGQQQMRAGPTGSFTTAQDTAAIQAAIAQAQRDAKAAASDPQKMRAHEEAARLALPRIQLEARIEAAKQIGLAPAVITQATDALQGDAQAIVQANTALDNAWAQITATNTLLAGAREEARGLLIQVRTQIASARAIAQSAGRVSASLTMQLQRLDTLANEADIAWGRLGQDPKLALENARQQLTEAANQVKAIVATCSAPDNDLLMRRALLQGRLNALETLAREAAQTQTLPIQEVDVYTNNIARLKQMAVASDDAALGALETQIEDLKNGLFAAVNARQQYSVAEVIAQTLAEEGFGAEDATSHRPIVVEVDEGVYRVTGLRNDAPAGMGHDDKLVTFTLLADGRIDYDFSGYIGEACKKDAQRIFAALRRKGIVIVSPSWLHEHDLASMSAQEVTAAPLPEFDVNKRQALVADRVRQALEHMGYQANQIVETSVGGVRQLDARNGSLGYYHVALDAFDEVNVTWNGQDISHDTGNAVVDAAALSQSTIADTLISNSADEQQTGYVAPQQQVSH